MRLHEPLLQPHILMVKAPLKGEISMVVPLSQLNAGEQARVVWIASGPDTVTRLTDLGFAPRNRHLRDQGPGALHVRISRP